MNANMWTTGDMNKPIYRHLADLKWRSHSRQILMQRINQMDVVPDILPAVDPTVPPPAPL